MEKAQRELSGAGPAVICELMRINAHSNNAALSYASLLTMGFANADDGKLPLGDKAIH